MKKTDYNQHPAHPLRLAVSNFFNEVPKIVERAQCEAIYALATKQPTELEKMQPAPFSFGYQEIWSPGKVNESPFRILGLVPHPALGRDRLKDVMENHLHFNGWLITHWQVWDRPADEEVSELVPKDLKETHSMLIPKARLILVHHEKKTAMDIAIGYYGFQFKGVPDNDLIHVACAGARVVVIHHDEDLTAAVDDQTLNDDYRALAKDITQSGEQDGNG